MHRIEELKKMAKAVLPIQSASQTYITVRQAAVMWKMSVGGAYNNLRVMVDRGMAEKVGSGHYHIFEVNDAG